MAHSIASRALLFTSSFEAEVFVALLLEKWHHPLSADAEYRHELLERTADVLRASADGEIVLQEMKPHDVNFIAALWYAEWATLQSSEGDETERQARDTWLNGMRR